MQQRHVVADTITADLPAGRPPAAGVRLVAAGRDRPPTSPVRSRSNDVVVGKQNRGVRRPAGRRGRCSRSARTRSQSAKDAVAAQRKRGRGAPRRDQRSSEAEAAAAQTRCARSLDRPPDAPGAAPSDASSSSTTGRAAARQGARGRDQGQRILAAARRGSAPQRRLRRGDRGFLLRPGHRPGHLAVRLSDPPDLRLLGTPRRHRLRCRLWRGPDGAAADGKVISEYYSSVYGNRLYLNVGTVNGKNVTVGLQPPVRLQGSTWATASSAARWSAMSATPAGRPAATCTSLSSQDGVAVDPMNWL